MLALGALVLGTLLPAVAHANGRFPRAERLLIDPDDAQHWVLAATYGLLVTIDGGKSWHHVCETAFAEPGLLTDPVVAFMPGGVLLTSIFESFSRSVDSGCDFKPTLAHQMGQAVPDFTVDADGTVLAALIATSDGKAVNQLQESVDAGRHFRALGPSLPDALRLVATLDAAPSDPKRLYVSGLGEGGVGLLLRSDDRGQTFESFSLPTDAASGEVPYIAAVDPKNPDALWVRTDVWKYDELAGVSMAGDALFYSSDGGEHFTELLRAQGKLYGFALAPDGENLLLGYGDPVEGGGRSVNPDDLGIYQGPAATGPLEKVWSGPVSCLTWNAEGIFACTSQIDLGFSLGRATVASLKLEGAAAFEPSLSLMEVAGPLDCPSCATGSHCRETWEATCTAWGREDCDEPLPENTNSAGSCEPDDASGGAGGVATDPGEPGVGSGGKASSGSGGSGPVTSTGGDPSTSTSPPKSNEAGCGCSVPQRAPSAWGSLLLLMAALGRRRRIRAAAASICALLLLTGCGDSDSKNSGDPQESSECTGDFDEFALGLRHQDDALSVEIVEADPAPPVVRGDNAWRIRVTDAEDEPINGAEITVSPYMPKHQHGAAEVVVQELGDGEYRLAPIELIMPGVWEIPMSITPPGAEASEVTFRLCIAEQ